MEFLLSHPTPNSLVVNAVHENGHQFHPRSTLLTGIGSNLISSVARLILPPCSNSASPSTKLSWPNTTISSIPRYRSSAMTFLITRRSRFRRSDLKDTTSVLGFCRYSCLFHCDGHTSWLYLYSLPKKIETIVKDLPFEGPKLFAEHTDQFLHSLKDSWAIVCFLCIYMPAPKRQPGKYQSLMRP